MALSSNHRENENHMLLPIHTYLGQKTLMAAEIAFGASFKKIRALLYVLQCSKAEPFLFHMCR